jgi:CubicO group peptidase (beta-lactamase class C family)
MNSHPDGRIDRVLHGLRPPVAIKGRPAVRWTMAERMAVLHVPGASIAIIDSGQVVWAGGFGVKETGTTDSVTTSTLFQAQSISKPVAATATLRLVEAHQLSLDEDVDAYLKSWKVPENRFNAQEKVTLRRILSHSAGFTVGGFGGYRLGDLIPTLLQILDGEKPANSPPIRVDTAPGSISRYSGGGFSVMQQLLIDVTGEPFPSLMKRLVLEPAGMTLSTYEQPLPEPRRKEAASGHDGEGAVIRGKWPIHPEMAAAGLWTTPTELAKWVLEIANASSGRPSKLLSKKMATEMLTVQKPPFGLGLFLKGEDQAFSFGHSGANLGFRAEFVTYPAVGKGAVVMTNADRGDILISEVFTSIATEYHWPARIQSEREVVTLATRQLDGLVGTYTLPPSPSGAPVYYEVSREGGQLFAELKGLGSYPKSEIYAASADSFFNAIGLPIVFTRDGSGRAVKVELGGQIEGIRKQ